MKKAALILIITAISICGSGFVLDQMLAKHGGIGYISSAIAAMKLRAAKPGMPPELVAAEAAKQNKGAMGLLKTLADGAANGLGGKPVEANEVYIRVAENHDAMVKPQLGTTANPNEIKGATHDINNTEKIALRATEDGREVIGVVHDSAVEDLSAVDRINAMNIPENLKEKILANYYSTGSLPEIVVKETRKPTSKPGDPDDPYNPKNF